MPDAPNSTTNISPNALRINKISVEIDRLVDELYDAKEAREITSAISNKYSSSAKGFSETQKIQILEEIKKVLDEHKKDKKKDENVFKQQEVIFDKDLKPGQIKRETLGPKLAKMMPYSPSATNYSQKDFAPDVYGEGWGRREKLEAIKRREGVVETASLVDDEYRKLVFAAKKETEAKIKLNAARLYSLVDSGLDISEEEKSKHTLKYSKAKDVFLDRAKDVHNFFEWAGRGIYSRTDAKKTAVVKDYINTRNELLGNLFSDFQGVKRKVLNDYRESLRSQLKDGLITQEQFDELDKVIQAEEKAEDVQSKMIEDTINKLTKDHFKDAEDLTSIKDQMWKFRLLQLALLVTPFAGLSLLGPISSIISSVFGGGGFAKGLASLATSEHLGFLGKIAEVLHIDDAIQGILNNVPVVENVVDVIDYVTQEGGIGNTLIQGALLPLIGSPIAQFVAAGGYSAVRAKTELETKMKYDAKFKAHNELLETKIKDLVTKKTFNADDFKSFVNKKFEISQSIFKNQVLSDTIAQIFNKGILEQVMGVDFINELISNKIIDDNGMLDNKALQKHSSKLDQKYADKIFLFKGVCRQCDSYVTLDEVLKNFDEKQKSKEGGKDIIAKELEYTNQDHAFSRAAYYDIYFDEEKINGKFSEKDQTFSYRKELAAKLEGEIKSMEIDEMKRRGGSGKAEQLRGADMNLNPTDSPYYPSAEQVMIHKQNSQNNGNHK